MTGWDWFLDGWIVVVGVLSAGSCALLGNYLVLRRLSLMGDAISHAVLPGLAVAFLLSDSRSSWPMFVGAVIAGTLTAQLTEFINHHGRVEHGAAMGVVFSVLFATGLILIRRAADHVDLDPGCVLYGNISQIPLDAIGTPPSTSLGFLGIETSVPPAARRLAWLMALNVAFVVLFYKELKITSFDPELATTLGIRTPFMHYALMIMVAMTTVANFEVVGSILVIAMLIVPPVTAQLLTDRLGVMIPLSLGLAAVSAVSGHLLAVFGPPWVGLKGSLNTAAMMTVTAGGLLGTVILAAPQTGLLSNLVSRVRLSFKTAQQNILGRLYRQREIQETTETGSPELPLGRLDWTSRWAIRLLQRTGAVTTRRRGSIWSAQLTPRGLREAAALVGSHRLWESYLAEHFDLGADHLHESAERMEHYITPHLRASLRDELSQQDRDPHGRAIPHSVDESPDSMEH